MSVLTRLAALRMQERELLNTPCGSCGHRLGAHFLIQRVCVGPSGVRCKCRNFVEPA